MTYWNQFKTFINSKEVRSIIKRSELFGIIPGRNFYEDQFRWMLMRAGYLKRLKPGQFLLLDKVPEDMTIAECISLVKRDNFTYIKLLEKRRKKRKKEKQNEI